MNVLSLFDGMSCGHLALDKAGIEVTSYYASEIDKYAMQVSKANYPDTHYLGSVVDVKAEDLPKIDLLIGGSPCQGFSFAGKQLNFDDPRSALFFEFVRLLEECKPTYFLLENVKMKKEYQDVISGYLGVEPIQINSSLVSAQNRVRLYWTNIPDVTQPEDLGITLGDIVEDMADGRPCELKDYKESSVCHHVANALDIKGNESIKRVYALDAKSPALTTMQGGHREPKVLCGAWRGRYVVDGVRQDAKMKTAGLTTQRLEIREDGKTNCLTTVQKDNNVVMLRVQEATKLGYTDIAPNEGVDLTFPSSKTRRGRAMRTKSNCLTAAPFDYGIWSGATYRKLTPTECERLQTVPDNYTNHVSNTQRYKMLGNGWTVDVIAHILKGIR